MTRSMLMGMFVCLGLVLVPFTGDAFHENGVRSCGDGEIGYVAIMLAEGGKVFTFLSTEDPPRAETILCQIAPQQLIMVKAESTGM